jgi:hypothetical protein
MIIARVINRHATVQGNGRYLGRLVFSAFSGDILFDSEAGDEAGANGSTAGSEGTIGDDAFKQVAAGKAEE